MEPLHLGALAIWLHPSKTKPAKARILLIHGINEHSGRHLNTVSFLTANGFEVIRFDLRGSGRSGGRRQWIKTFEDYVEDTTQVYNWIHSQQESLPLFVLGHSLGGAIAVYFAASYGKNLKGLILSAPAYIVGGAISQMKIKLGQFLNRLTPTLRVPNGGDPEAISRDPRMVTEYANDPLSFHFNTVQQANEVLSALKNIRLKAAEITTPTFIVHGTGDRIIRLEGSFEILQALGTKIRTMMIIPGGYHEPHNDLDKENYFTTLSQWLENRCKEIV